MKEKEISSLLKDLNSQEGEDITLWGINEVKLNIEYWVELN